MDLIKGKKVTVQSGESIVYFSGGEDGKDYEIGEYCFWTAIGKDEFGPWEVIGRGLRELPACDRFQRMDQDRLMSPAGEDRIAYQMMWDRFDTIELVRPSYMREIVRWFETHKQEGEFAGVYAYLDGEPMLIPRAMV